MRRVILRRMVEMAWQVVEIVWGRAEFARVGADLAWMEVEMVEVRRTS